MDVKGGKSKIRGMEGQRKEEKITTARKMHWESKNHKREEQKEDVGMQAVAKEVLVNSSRQRKMLVTWRAGRGKAWEEKDEEHIWIKY